MRWSFVCMALFGIGTAALAGDKDEIVAAGKKVIEGKSYSWSGTLKFEGQLPFGGGQEIPEAKFSGTQDGHATHIVTDSAEFIRVGDRTVRRPRGEWRLVEENPEGEFRRGGFGRFMGMMAAPRSPADEFAKLEDSIRHASKADATEKVGDAECTVYSGDLTEEAALQAAPMGRMVERMGGEASGTFKVWVDPEGRICKYEVTIKVSGSVQGNDFEITSIRTVTLKDFGTAKVEVPPEAKAALERKGD